MAVTSDYIETPLTAVEVGSSLDINVERYGNHTLAYTVAEVGAGESITLRPQGSIDNTNFFKLPEGDIVISANGTYALSVPLMPLKTIRFEVVSRVGSTATASVAYMGGARV